MKAEVLTAEVCKKEMTKRGYSHTASSGNGETLFFVRGFPTLGEGDSIGAKVALKSQSIDLYFVNLKYFAKLSMEHFDFWHQDFEKHEQILCMYAAKCLDIDVFQVLLVLGLKQEAEEPKVRKSIEDRKLEFWEKIRTAGKGKYEKEMCKAFYDYWIEMNDGGRKMRFEMQEVFSIAKRLVTWSENDKNFGIKKRSFAEEKAEKQNKETEIKKIDKSKLF